MAHCPNCDADVCEFKGYACTPIFESLKLGELSNTYITQEIYQCTVCKIMVKKDGAIELIKEMLNQ